MTSSNGDTLTIQKLVEQFTDTETSLRRLTDAADGLASAKQQLEEVRLQTQLQVDQTRREVEQRAAEALQQLEATRRSVKLQFESADHAASERLAATVQAVEAQLTAAQQVLRDDLAASVQALGSSQRSLTDTAAGIQGLTTELRNIAHELKDSSIALRGLDPVGLRRDLEAVAAAQRSARLLQIVLLVAVLAVGVIAAVV
jgi:hypothetical protein